MRIISIVFMPAILLKLIVFYQEDQFIEIFHVCGNDYSKERCLSSYLLILSNITCLSNITFVMKHPQHLLKLSLNLFVLFHIFSLIIFVLYYCLFVGLFDCFSNIWPSCLCSCFCQGTYLISQGKSITFTVVER